MSERSGTGCLKGAAVGCGSCFLLVVILVVGTWAGWGTLREVGPFKRIRSLVETAQSEAEQMSELSRALGKRYPNHEVGLRADIRTAEGITVKTLVVSIAGPANGFPEDASAKEALARDLAAQVANDYETIDRYDQIRVALSEQGEGSRLGTVSEFQFPVAKLRSGGEPAAPPISP